MGKKEKRFISLSEVDHKLQFINVIAVIAEITPTISRSKLTKIELCLLDETVKRPGFNVKLSMEIEMLNHFLNVAKRGFIIQLNDIRVTKNEGKVYGEVQDEEEITFYNDSPHVHKWYPGEKPAAVTDTTKLKVLSMVKWKKANFKDIEVLQESNEDQSKTRRSGLTSDGKSQSSKSLNKISTNDGSTVSNNKTQIITANDQEVEDNLSVSKENKLKGAASKRSSLERSTSINEPTKHAKANKTSISSEETESQSTNSSRASISPRNSQVKRASDASNINKSLSLSNLNKSVTTRSLNKSLSLSRINKSDISKRNKSLSLSKLNKSQSQTNLNYSKVSSSRQNLTKGVKAKRESESLKPVRLTRSISTSKIKEITSSSDSNIDEISIEQSSSDTHSYRFSSTPHKPDKENNKDKNLTQTQSFAENKNKDISIINTPKKSLKNKKADFTGSTNYPANKKQSKCLNSKTEEAIPVSKHPQNSQRGFVSRDTKKNMSTVKSNETKINRNKQYNAAMNHGKVETRGATKSESNCDVLTKVKNKQAEEKSVNEEKLSNFDTLKRTRQTIKNKTEGSPSVSNTDCLVINDSNSSSPNTSPKLRKLECNTNRESRRNKNVLVDKTEVNNQPGKDIHNSNSLTRTKDTDSLTDSPTRKKTRLTYGCGQLSDTSSETSHKSKLKPFSIGKNPTLNTSDSTLSESSNHSVNKINISRKSLHMQKRDFNQIDIPSGLVSVSRKRLKLDQEIGANKSERSSPSLENYLSNPVNEEQTEKSTKTSETEGKSNENGNENDNGSGLSNKGGNSGPYLKTNENRKFDKNEDLRKTARLDKEEVKTLPKTRRQVFEKSQPNDDKQSRITANCINNSVKNNRESGKGGTFETYLRPFTKKLNFISVENITDISLYDLEEVCVPEKFDLQCKVVSEFVLVEEGIQVVRVEDGTLCKCDTLKIPQGHSWDIISKEILNNPMVEDKSQYIDVIIFNYFRLDFPIKPGKFFRINNIMAIKFQLKRDPRENRKSKSEFFFCVEGQNANIRKLSSQQVKELQERISAAPQKSTLSATINGKAVAEKPVSDVLNFKLPASPKMDGKSNMSSDKKSPIKTKPVIEESGSGLKPKTRRINDSDSDIDPEVMYPRGRSLAEDKKKKENLRKNSETCIGNIKTYENLEAKINTTNSSDETMMGETPPLMREINEIIQEESALGLPLTVTEDVHLKNSGSEVTFSQFCEGAKLKGDNFRTSTQDIEADILNIDFSIVRNLTDLPKDVLVKNKEGNQSEDTNKMEPLVYCPSGSSASSAVCGSPGKGKTPQDTQDSQQCSASVLHGTRVKTISNLEPSNSESQKVMSNSSDLSNSSSVKVISSNSSLGIDLEVLVSKNVSKNQTTTKVTEVESTVSSEVKHVSLLTSKSSALPKDKVSGSVLESVCISGNSLNQASSNDDIEVVSDNSSNDSLLVSGNNTTIKPTSKASANVIDDAIVHNLEHAKLIPDRCFYKSPTTPPTLTEHELNEIYDDENSVVKYFSYCHDRDLPMLTLDIIGKIRNTNSLTMTVTFVSISPAFTDSWKEGCMKARCPSCDKLYDVFNAANNKNHENPSATAAISVGSHIVCPDSQCSNQILENPEFHFSVEFKLEDGTLLTALLGGQCAEDVFGCSAPEAMRNESALSRVAEILEKITKRVSDKLPTKVVVKRQDVCNPKSGPLCLAHVGV